MRRCSLVYLGQMCLVCIGLRQRKYRCFLVANVYKLDIRKQLSADWPETSSCNWCLSLVFAWFYFSSLLLIRSTHLNGQNIVSMWHFSTVLITGRHSPRVVCILWYEFRVSISERDAGFALIFLTRREMDGNRSNDIRVLDGSLSFLREMQNVNCKFNSFQTRAAATGSWRPAMIMTPNERMQRRTLTCRVRWRHSTYRSPYVGASAYTAWCLLHCLCYGVRADLLPNQIAAALVLLVIRYSDANVFDADKICHYSHVAVVPVSHALTASGGSVFAWLRLCNIIVD